MGGRRNILAIALLTTGRFTSVPSARAFVLSSAGVRQSTPALLASRPPTAATYGTTSKERAGKICPLLDVPLSPETTADFAMGCFWTPQRDFDRTRGVISTTVGYSGSNDPATSNPTYQNIQDYSESIRVTFDSDVVSYADLLEMFFAFHEPGNPAWTGTQYRSAIFPFGEEQRELAEAAVKRKGALGNFVAVEDAGDFYEGEEYHQHYLDKMMGM